MDVETVRFGLSYLVVNDRLGKADYIFSGRDGEGSVIASVDGEWGRGGLVSVKAGPVACS